MHSLDNSTQPEGNIQQSNARAPWGIKWRSSVWFVTLVVGWGEYFETSLLMLWTRLTSVFFEGINTDLIVYTVIVPVIPFRLQALGYDDVSSLLGGLLLAYVGGFPLTSKHLTHHSLQSAVFALCQRILIITAVNFR